jgi:hypothetical protein
LPSLALGPIADQVTAMAGKFLRGTSMSTPQSMFAAELVLPAARDAVLKLAPRELIKNPVLFTTAVVALLLCVLMVVGSGLSFGFQLQLIVWLWLTVLFGTFAEALAEGRGRAQAASLRATKSDLVARCPMGAPFLPASFRAAMWCWSHRRPDPRRWRGDRRRGLGQ